MTPLHRATLVMEPFATPLTPEALLAHPQFAADLVRALRGAHTAGIIHCDVRFENVYVHAGGVIIADWGFAYRLAPDAQPRPAIGTVATAAEEVLIASLGDRLLTPKKQHDLQSCVRMAVLAHEDGRLLELFQLAVQRHGYIVLDSFWRWQLAYPPWARAEKLAIDCSYDELATCLQTLLEGA